LNNLIEQDIVTNQKSVILKPTGLCNANCKFCYASNFSENCKSIENFDTKFKSYIENKQIRNVILTGGEITLVPKFLEEICNYADKNNISISLVSNMIEILKNVEHWQDFFKKHEKLHLTASYQTDNQRSNFTGEKISEIDFINFAKWYRKELNKRLLVISVVNDENENKILENIYLAKECKYVSSIERQIGIGRAKYEYSPLKYFKLLNKIIDMGMWQYEKHLRLLVQSGMFGVHYCNFYCKQMVPVIYIDKNENLVETFCDHLSTTKFSYKDFVIEKDIKKECAFCKYRNLCQACHITRKNINSQIANGQIDISIYCKELKDELKKLENNILQIRGKNGTELSYKLD